MLFFDPFSSVVHVRFCLSFCLRRPENPGCYVPASEVLAGKQLVGLYFGASWCGYCLRFSPLLEVLYRKSPKDKLEIVFVSSCSTQEDHDAYIKDMPWPSVPFRDSRLIGYVRKAVRDQTGQQQGRLATLFRVSGLPSLIILDSNGQVLRTDGRQDIQQASRVEDAMDIWDAALSRRSGPPATGGPAGTTSAPWAAAGGLALAGVAAAWLLRSRKDTGRR